MTLKSIKLLVDWNIRKKGDIINMSVDAANSLIQEGFAEDISEQIISPSEKADACSPEHKGEPAQLDKNSPDGSGKKGENKNIAKEILDKWATAIITKDKIYLENEEAKVKNRQSDYTTYSQDIILWIPPKDSVTIEFEDEKERNLRYIRECESSAKSLKYDYCITGHTGHSDYFRMFNIKGMPLGEDNKLAKMLLVDMIMPASAKNQLDRTNLGWTLSPVIGHAHWKPKYNGAVHQLLRGKNPLEHNNEYPKELLTQLKKSKTKNKKYVFSIKQNDSWVEDFLLNFCCEHELPSGSRHFIIEKNLAAYIIHRQDREEIKEKYYKAQKRNTDTLRTWETAILRGDYTNVSAGELTIFIREHNLPFIIPSKQQVQTEPKSYITTPDEISLLKNPQLLNIIDNEFNKKIVGEQANRKAIFLNACGKWVENGNIASYNLCLNSNSGAGKDYTCKCVLKIFPKDDIYIRSRISPTAFTYWHNAKFEPEWTWDNKALLLSDVSDNILNGEVFKLMCSDETFSTVVINQQAVDIIVKGKPVLFITTASANPNNEMLRRFPFLELNETVDQTKAIKAAQAKAATMGLTTDYNPLVTNSLNKLKRVKVRIPFASLINESFPDEHIIMRTHFSRLLDYIKASAALHQFQRETDTEGFIIATPYDYDNATIPLQQTTSNPMMIPLTKKQKMLLAVCKELKEFSVKDIAPHAPFIEESKIYDALPKLQEFGFLESDLKTIDTSRKPVRYYQYKPFELKTIPKWVDIIESCRKKGIEVNMVIKENKVIEGNDSITIPLIPSIHPPTPTPESTNNVNESFLDKIKHAFKPKKEPKKQTLTPIQQAKKDYADVLEIIHKIDYGQGFELQDFLQEYSAKYPGKNAQQRFEYARIMLGIEMLQSTNKYKVIL